MVFDKFLQLNNKLTAQMSKLELILQQQIDLINMQKSLESEIDSIKKAIEDLQKEKKSKPFY